MIRVAPREPRVIPAASVGLYASAAAAYMNFGSAANLDNVNPSTRAVLFYYRATNYGKQFPDLLVKAGWPNQNVLFFDADAVYDNFAPRGQVGRATTDATAVAVANTFSLGRWYLVTMTYSDSDGIRIYVGSYGVPIAECSYASRVVGSGAKDSDSSESLLVGGRTNADGGSLCDYAFAAYWSGILTLGQMRELQAWLSPEMIRVGPPPETLKGGCRLWTFPGAHGYNKYIDFSGFGNHGAPSGSEIRLAKPAPSVLLSRNIYKAPAVAPSTDDLATKSLFIPDLSQGMMSIQGG